MIPVLALVAEIVSLVPQAIQAGLEVTALVQKARDVLDANAAPDDVDWQALDEQVNGLRARLSLEPPSA